MNLESLQQDAVTSLCKSLTRYPERWVWSDSNKDTFIAYKGTEVQLFIYGGHAYLHRPFKIKLGFWDTRRLKRAVRHWRLVQGNKEIEEAACDACLHVIEALRPFPVIAHVA